MIKVNCPALPSALVESELFGREKGAYTGALSKQIGRFELADHSTLFLDEIGDLPLELQGKLLRVLQEGEFERLGSPKTVQVDTRVIAATNRDLTKAVRDGTFREDLFYRLNVFSIAIPPLREHPEDIPLLAWTFVRQFGESMAKVIDSIPRPTMDALERYHWPGNVRQLRNVIEQAMITCTGPVLNVNVPKQQVASAEEGMTLEEVERRHILTVLSKARWRVSGSGGAAEILGMKPTTLESRMQKLGIQRKD
jgi:transcriptional regulator with GAF, ATPase, and Fis domain